MSTSNDPGQRDVGFARYLAGMSRATRAIGIFAVLGSLLTILVTWNTVRNSSDRVGFTLVALTLLLFGVLVWGVGVFHGTFAHFVGRVVAIDRKLDRLEGILARASQQEAGLPAHGPAPGQVAHARATAAATLPDEPDRVPAEAEVAAPGSTESRQVVAGPAEPEPVRTSEPERTPCPHCGGLIHPQATRCVHCMKKVAR